MKIMTVWNWLGSVFSHDRRDQIIIRQTLDPYVNIPYVAWRKVTLESNGDLCMGKIGLGMPGDKFVIACHDDSLDSVSLFSTSKILRAIDVKRLASFEDDEYPILTVVERCDAESALKRLHLRDKDRVGYSESTFSHNKIIVRQTLDPYADNLQYVAWHKATREHDGSLHISKIGLAMHRGDLLILCHEPPPYFLFSPGSDILRATQIDKMASFESDCPVLTVVERRNAWSASYRIHLQKIAKEREERIKYWKGLMAHAWNWLRFKLAFFLISIKSRHHGDSDSLPISPKGENAVSSIASSFTSTAVLVHRHGFSSEEPEEL